MFKGIKQIFSARNKDVKNKILFTLLILFIYKLGTTVRVPGTENITQDLGFLELLNVMGGGSLRNFSIFALGVTPYISASIIVQLLQMDIIPYFSNLAKEGYSGRTKLNKITRYLGIALAFLQGLVMSFSFLGESATSLDYLRVTLILTAGTCFLLWLGDQITRKGVGNGISILIMAGILISMPNVFTNVYNTFIHGNMEIGLGVTLFVLYIICYILIIVGIIWVQLAERRIPIQYSNRTTSAYGAQQSFLPIKLNSAGVIPVIFAPVLTTIPGTIVALTKNDAAINFVNNYISYTSPTGFLLYIILIFAFSYFYTFLSMNPEEMSKNLNKNGGYIPGVRPGADTSGYISKTLSRVTLVGAVFLVILAGLPILISSFSGLPTSVSLGGTGILIVVGVVIETYKQIESSLTARSYAERKRRFR